LVCRDVRSVDTAKVTRAGESLMAQKVDDVIRKVFAEYEALSGRRYDLVEGYRMEDADAALFILNSAAETAKEAVDALRKQGLKVGLVRPNVIRPFPIEEVRAVLKNVKGLVVADRQDNFGAWGGAMAIEVKAALQGLKGNATHVAARVFGTGGKEFFVEDAEAMLHEALEIAKAGTVKEPYAYFGVNPGDPAFQPAKAFDPISEADASGLIRVETTPEGKMEVKGNILRNLTERPKRIGPGHGACPGCGIFVNMNTFMKGIEGYVVILFHTGCGMVVTTGYPYTAHKITYIHNLFQNGAATLSGVVEMFERTRSPTSTTCSRTGRRPSPAWWRCSMSARAAARSRRTRRSPSSWSPATAATTSAWDRPSAPRCATTG